MTIEEVEAAIGLPVDKWPGNCHGVASLIVGAGLIDGTTRYGHYRGYIASDSRFSGQAGVGWAHHGWIELPGGEVCDPTRFVFEAVAPYIYIGCNGGDYDAGGDVLREDLETPFPVSDELVVGLDIDIDTGRFLRELTQSIEPYLSVTQVFWLANLSRQTLGPFAPQVYEAIADAGYRAAIPIDNWRYYFGEEAN